MEENSKFLYKKAIWYVIIATITILLVNVFSIARFSAVTQGMAEVNFAKPVLEVESSTYELNDLDIDNKEIAFDIKNFNENEDNGVALNYRIRLVIEGSEEEIPIQCKLYRIDNEERVECELTDEYISESFYMPHTEHKIENFILAINVEDAEFQDTSYQMKIVLDAEQKI